MRQRSQLSLVVALVILTSSPPVKAACFDDDGSYCDPGLSNDGWFEVTFSVKDILGRGVFAAWMNVQLDGWEWSGGSWQPWSYSPTDPACPLCGWDIWTDENGRMSWGDFTDNLSSHPLRVYRVSVWVLTQDYPCYVNGGTCTSDGQCVGDPASHDNADCVGGRCADQEEYFAYGRSISSGGGPGTDYDSTNWLGCDAASTTRPTYILWSETRIDTSSEGFDSVYIGHDIRQPFAPQPNPATREFELDLDGSGPGPRALSTIYYGVDFANPRGWGAHGPYDNALIFASGFDGAGAGQKHTRELRRDRFFMDAKAIIKGLWERGLDVWLFVPSDGGLDLLLQAKEAALATHLAATHRDQANRGPMGGNVTFLGLSAGGLVGRLMLARWTDFSDPFLGDLNAGCAALRSASPPSDCYFGRNGNLLPAPSIPPISAVPPVSLLAFWDTPNGGANMSLDFQQLGWVQNSARDAGVLSCAAQQMLRNSCWMDRGPPTDNSNLVVACDPFRAREFFQGGDADGDGVAGVISVFNTSPTVTCGEPGFPGMHSIGPDGDGYPATDYLGDGSQDLKIIALAQGTTGAPLTCYKDARDGYQSGGRSYDLCPQTGAPTTFEENDLAGEIHVRGHLTGLADRYEDRWIVLDAWDVLPGSRAEMSVKQSLEDQLSNAPGPLPPGFLADGNLWKVTGAMITGWLDDHSLREISYLPPLFLIKEMFHVAAVFIAASYWAEMQYRQYNTFTFIPTVSVLDDRACDLMDDHRGFWQWDAAMNHFNLVGGAVDWPDASCRAPSPNPHPKIDTAYINTFNGAHTTGYPGSPHFDGFMREIVLQGQFCGTAPPGAPETNCDGLDNDRDCFVDDGITSGIACQYVTPNEGFDANQNGVGDTQELFWGCLTEQACGTLDCPMPSNFDYYYYDRDGDGYGCRDCGFVVKHCDPTGMPIHPIAGCVSSGCGFVLNEDDCDDLDADKGYGVPVWRDRDGDGMGGSLYGGIDCFPVEAGWSPYAGDCCDDTFFTLECGDLTHDGFIDFRDTDLYDEIPQSERQRCDDGIDNDCDGLIDLGDPDDCPSSLKCKKNCPIESP